MAVKHIASVALLATTVAWSGLIAGCSPNSSQHPSQPATPAGSLPSARATSPPESPGPLLDGTYRVDTAYSQGTSDGQRLPGGTEVTRWYAFRSTCTAAGCTAAATQLGNDGHTGAMPNGATATLRFAGGRWETIVPIAGSVACKANPEVAVKITTSWSFAPQNDGTLAGTKVYTELRAGTGPCTGTGRTATYPITLVRVGTVPTGVAIADPPPA
jgi:serine/threonine protein kinase, bacterial